MCTGEQNANNRLNEQKSTRLITQTRAGFDWSCKHAMFSSELKVIFLSLHSEIQSQNKQKCQTVSRTVALFSIVLDQAKIPQQWKLAEISPAHKKECKLTKSNYRQLSILPSLSKVFERLVHNRASPYFENIFHKFVFAYRKFHGCDTALLCLTEIGKESWITKKLLD